MGRRSAVHEFLRRLPLERRAEVARILQSSPSHRSAYEELKSRYRFKGSYDAVKHWRQTEVKLGVENVTAVLGTSRTTRQATTSQTHNENEVRVVSADSIDSIKETVKVGEKLNVVCNDLADLIQIHKWGGSNKSGLTNRDALKIIAALPSLFRASYSGLLEMHRLKIELKKKENALGTLFEFGEDWRRTLEHDNPELISIFEGVAAVTKARLDLDTPTVLEVVLQAKAQSETD